MVGATADPSSLFYHIGARTLFRGSGGGGSRAGYPCSPTSLCRLSSVHAIAFACTGRHGGPNFIPLATGLSNVVFVGAHPIITYKLALDSCTNFKIMCY